MNIVEGQGDVLLTKEIVLKDGTPATLEAKRIGHGISVNVEAAGEYCGGTTFGENSWADMPGTWSATTSHVNTEWRRKGVATAVYDAMEEMGYTVVPEPRHNKRSADAEAFWKNRKQVREGDYRGEHIAPSKDGGAPLYDLTTEGMYPEDVYGPNGGRYYAPDEPDAFYKCMSYKGRPNKVITIYRAVPADLVRPKITPGDWVAITPAYAREHGRSHLQGAFKVLTKTVYARDIYTEGNSLDEWGYDPQPFVSSAQEDQIRVRLGMKTKAEARAAEQARRQPVPEAKTPYVQSPFVNTPQFKAWFKDSKVRHPKTGEPTVVFHGTKEDFSAFAHKDVQGGHHAQAFGPGFYFTDNPSRAKPYAGRSEGANTKPCYLSIQNPKIYHSEGLYFKEIGVNGYFSHNDKRASKTEELKSQGYDGIMVWRTELPGNSIEWIAFYPNQIKSVLNTGSFSDSENIQESYQWRKMIGGDVQVMIDVAKLDASFAKDREFYVGPQGAGGISGRYERFGNWLNNGEAVGMPEVCLNDNGEVAFINGRHRFAWMRDHGVKKLPVAVPAEDAKAIQSKFGVHTRMVEDVLEFNQPGEVIDTREFGGLTFKRQEGGMHNGFMWFVYRGTQIIGAFAEDWRHDCLVIHTDLYPEFTRSGFGSIIYDFADTLAAERGLEVAPAYLQTDAAKRFWEKRRASKVTEGWQEEKAKINAVDGERWTHLEALFASKGFHPIGKGSKGRVYGSDSYPYVVKLFRKDRAYEAFLNFAKAFPNKHYAKARGEVKTISEEGEYRIIRLEKLVRASEATARMYLESMRALTSLRVLKALEHHDEDDLIASFERFSNYGIKNNAHLMAMIEKDEQVLADMNPTFVEAMRQIIDSFADSEVGAFDTNPANVMERPDGTPVIIDPLQPRY